MKIGLFGVGAIGSVIASALISNKRISLQFFNRSPKEKIKLQTTKELLEFPIKLSDPRIANPPLDWLIICLKANQYPAALADLKQLLGSETKVAVIRNGLQHKSSVNRFTSDRNILECIIDAPTQVKEDGSYKLLSQAFITCPESNLATAFSELIAGSTCRVDQTLDFKTACWKKLCESATLGAILSLTGNTARVLKKPKLFDLYKILLQESIAVAIADGAQLETDFAENILEKASNYPPLKSSSMLQDKLTRRPMELEAKNGVIVDLGKRYSINTPYSNIVFTFLTNINKVHSQTENQFL